MQKTNYCADILDTPQEVKDYIAAQYGYNPFEQYLKESIKFRLPDNGCIFEFKREPIADIIEKYCPEMRLPYPCVALEYYVDMPNISHDGLTRYDASVVLAVERGEAPDIKILVLAFNRLIKDGIKRWLPNEYSITLSRTDAGSISINPRNMRTTLKNKLVNMEAAYNDMAHETAAVVQLMSALSCSNSMTCDDDKPSAALNRKREMAGKTPFYSYKILELKPGIEQSKSVAQGGTHASPRVHLRRGHIRRLPSGNIWINAMLVGDKSKGLIAKEYSVRVAS